MTQGSSERSGGQGVRGGGGGYSNWHDHITMLTTHYSPLYYKNELASGQGTFRKPRKKTKLSHSSKHKHIQVPEQVTLSGVYPGTSGRRGVGTGGEERNSMTRQVCFSAPRQVSSSVSSRSFLKKENTGGPTYFYHSIYLYSHREPATHGNGSIT